MPGTRQPTTQPTAWGGVARNLCAGLSALAFAAASAAAQQPADVAVDYSVLDQAEAPVAVDSLLVPPAGTAKRIVLKPPPGVPRYVPGKLKPIKLSLVPPPGITEKCSCAPVRSAGAKKRRAKTAMKVPTPAAAVAPATVAPAAVAPTPPRPTPVQPAPEPVKAPPAKMTPVPGPAPAPAPVPAPAKAASAPPAPVPAPPPTTQWSDAKPPAAKPAQQAAVTPTQTPPQPQPSAPPQALTPPPRPAAPTAPPAPAAKPAETQVAAVPPAPKPAETKAEQPLSIVYTGGSAIPADAAGGLKEIGQRLAAEPSLRVQLLSYASDAEKNVSRARRLSLERAVAVRKFLIDNGLDSTRIEVRALGDQNAGGPADRVDVVVSPRR